MILVCRSIKVGHLSCPSSFWGKIHFLNKEHSNLAFFSYRQTKDIIIGVVEREKKSEIGGLLTWLEWLFCSCAIICGGALRAALQHQTVLHTSLEKWSFLRCQCQSLVILVYQAFCLHSYWSKGLHLYPQASNCKGLRQFKLNPSHHFEFDTCYIRFVYTHKDDTIHFLKYDSIWGKEHKGNLCTYLDSKSAS